MKATVKTKIGKAEYTFELEEQTEMETLHKVAVLANPPDLCNECQNTDSDEGFKLASNKDSKGHTYVNIVCNRCNAKAKLGQYLSGGYFWKPFEIYTKGEQNG